MTQKLRPADCKDRRTASKLNESSIQFNEDCLKVLPNYVELTLSHTTVKISMHRFRQFAEWYLEEQEIES